jgi:Caspase domain
MAVETPPKPRRLALLVATSRHDDPWFDELRGAAGDIQALERVLVDPKIGDYKIAGSLMDEPKQVIEEAIADFFRSGLPQDLLLLYLSGHGVLSENRKHWFFVASNSKRNNLDATAIWDAWLKERMANSRSNSIVLVLDCCHSGAFIEGRLAKGGREVHVEDHFEGAGTGRVTMTASTALEYAFESDQLTTEDLGALAPGSMFTKYLVGGLQSRDADLDMDGKVSLDELFRYIERKLQAETPKQTPGWGGQTFGPIYLAHGRRTFLPAEVWTGLSSQNAAVRRGMLAVLTELRAAAARQRQEESADALTEIDTALGRLATDDSSDAVRQASSAILAQVRGGPSRARTAKGPARRRRSFAGSGAPFGIPDGIRAELRDLMDGLVEFRGERDLSALDIDAHDRSARVIVGRRGAGKSLHLRRLQAASYTERAIYAPDVQRDVFRTEHVLLVLDWCRDPRIAIERWAEIWRCAILRSVISHLLTVRELRENRSSGLLASRHELYPQFRSPASTYDQVADILGTARHADALDRYLADRAWASLTATLTETLRVTKPVCFYLDGLDERFDHAPRQWLLCQLGLFRAVMNLRSDPRFASRLNVTIGLRDVAFSALRATESADRFIDPSIRILDWDYQAIEYFLHRKLETLTDSYLMEPRADEPIQRWLGLTSIENEAGDRSEPIVEYLLRHTRLVPRDVVILGNALCELVMRAHQGGRTFVSESDLRAAVAVCAREIGKAEILTAANHLTAEAMPQGAAADGYADFYTGETAATWPYLDATAADLAVILRALEQDRFPRASLEELQTRMRAQFETRLDPIDVLWQHGLIGFVDGPVLTGSVTFYSLAHEGRLTLPRDRDGYALHPIVLAAVGGLREIGEPIQPL